MPRTRSLAWSELKIGVVTIVALIVSAMLQRSDRGTTTELRLMPPEAFTQLAVPEEADSSSVKRK